MAVERSGKIIIRQHFQISGIVHGVGFRPFIYRLAHENRLTGWVRNTPGGVEIEVQGTPEVVAGFARLISSEAPPLAVIGPSVPTIFKRPVTGISLFSPVPPVWLMFKLPRTRHSATSV